MKKWSLIVAGLYSLIILTMLGPLTWIAFFGEPSNPGNPLLALSPLLLSWQLWITIAIMIAAQFALLRVPVYVATRRTVTRRALLTTVMAASFMMGLLVFGAAASLYEFFSFPGGGTAFWIIPVVVGLGSWAGWAFYFHRVTKNATGDVTMTHLRRYLWTGSILELLVAVPTHIVARYRDYCCAGVLTFIGLTCGMSVMIFAFGPAVYFVFAERWKRLHPNRDAG